MNYYKHFTLDEFKCKCGCGRNEINPQLVEKLDNLRDIYYQRPLIVSSGYRCARREEEVGGSGFSHPAGLAADLVGEGNQPIDGRDLYDLMMGLMEQGIPRIIIYSAKPHIHIDINDHLPQGIFRR